MHSEKEPDIRQETRALGLERADLLRGAQRKSAERRRAGRKRGGRESALHVCCQCAGELVYPLDWCEQGSGHWRVLLRCPECEARREGVFEQAIVEALDDELDRGSNALLEDLRCMTHANMCEEIEFFIRALHADVITPSDF